MELAYDVAALRQMKALRKSDAELFSQVREALEDFAEKDAAMGPRVKRLTNRAGQLRIRIGNWRAIVAVHQDTVTVLRVAHRQGGVSMIDNDTITLTRAEHQALLDRIEELEAERLVLPDPDPARSVPAEVANRIFEGESALRAWRKHRGLTLRQLAGRSGLSVSYLSELEAGKRAGPTQTLKALAEALACGLPTLIE